MARKNYKGIFDLIESRYACAILEDMRKMQESSNYSGLKASIEELQTYCTRMEDGLWAARNASEDTYNHLTKDKPDVKSAKKSLEKRWKKLKKTK